MPLPHESPAAPLLVGCRRHLETIHRRLEAGDALLRPALASLREHAESALAEGPFSVVADPGVPPSGDRHDYTSVGPYWWPDPGKPDGLPYIRRDGEVNPERNDGDCVAMGRMARAVGTLALAYCHTADERYAERAAHLLRAWFLDSATRMNPHLTFAQAIPGRCQGRGVGLIDTTCLVDLLDRVLLLQTSPHWTEDDHEGLRAWFDAYVEWLLGSELGRDEARAHNNHGTWYDAQVAAFALFVGHDSVAADILARVGETRIAPQIRPDGAQPHELARTKAWSYSIYNLNAFLVLARLGERVGLDLWRFATAEGAGLRVAIGFLLEYVDGRAPWPYPQLGGWHPEILLGTLLMAGHGLGEPSYLAAARVLPPVPERDAEWLLRYPLGD